LFNIDFISPNSGSQKHTLLIVILSVASFFGIGIITAILSEYLLLKWFVLEDLQ